MENIFKKYNHIIKDDIPLYIDMINSYNLGLTDIIESTDDTLILRLKDWPLYLPLSSNPDELIMLLSKYDIHWMVLRNKEVYEVYKDKGYFDNPCYQVYYDGPKLKLKNNIEIKKPRSSDIIDIGKSYDMGGLEEIRRANESDSLFAAYIDDNLIGYIGIHDDLSCGMLHVFDKYRNKGYGLELEKYIINYQLDKGVIPYGQVLDDNLKSLSLQNKLNMRMSSGLIYWMWKD